MMTGIRPNNERAKWAMIMVIVTAITRIIFSYYSATVPMPTEDVEIFDGGYLMVLVSTFLYLSAFIISIVCFIRWFRRAYYNLNQTGQVMIHEDVWAAGSWFVPIMNLFRPYQMMKEIYLEAKEHLLARNIDAGHTLSTTLVGVWWATWLFSNVLDNISSRISDANNLELIAAAISIPSAITAVLVINTYNKIEPLLVPDGSSIDITDQII